VNKSELCNICRKIIEVGLPFRKKVDVVDDLEIVITLTCMKCFFASNPVPAPAPPVPASVPTLVAPTPAAPEIECLCGKDKYSSEQAAKKAIEKIMENNPGVELNTYLCPDNKRIWHITSKSWHKLLNVVQIPWELWPVKGKKVLLYDYKAQLVAKGYSRYTERLSDGFPSTVEFSENDVNHQGLSLDKTSAASVPSRKYVHIVAGL
jgi:hypothetical protein